MENLSLPLPKQCFRFLIFEKPMEKYRKTCGYLWKSFSGNFLFFPALRRFIPFVLKISVCSDRRLWKNFPVFGFLSRFFFPFSVFHNFGIFIFHARKCFFHAGFRVSIHIKDCFLPRFSTRFSTPVNKFVEKGKKKMEGSRFARREGRAFLIRTSFPAGKAPQKLSRIFKGLYQTKGMYALKIFEKFFKVFHTPLTLQSLSQFVEFEGENGIGLDLT